MTHVLKGGNKNKESKNESMSGIFILMMAVTRNNSKEMIWKDQIFKIAKKCKPNLLKIYSHHETKGFTNSFRNKPLYGNVNGSSVSTYCNKKNKNKDKQDMIKFYAIELEQMCVQAIHNGIS